MQITINPKGEIQIPAGSKGISFQRRRLAKKDLIQSYKAKAKELNQCLTLKI